MFDDNFDGVECFDCAVSAGPVAPDKRVRQVAQACPSSGSFVSAQVHRVFVSPFHTGPPA